MSRQRSGSARRQAAQGESGITPAPSRERVLAARGLSHVQIAALLGGAPLAWVRAYVPGSLPRGFCHPCPSAARPQQPQRVIVEVAPGDEPLPEDWLATVVLHLLDDAERPTLPG